MTSAAAPKLRLAFIDNLRWMMIVFVIGTHAAVTYSHLGSWYYMEGSPPGGLTLFAFATIQCYWQAFFMGFLFFIAGYFVPGACDRKGSGRFLRDRLVRLGIPTLLYMLVLHPVTMYIRPNGWTFSWAQYSRFVTSLRWVGNSGPLWFALALLIFSAAYAAWRATRGPAVNHAAPPPGSRAAIAVALIIGACTFLVRTVQPIGTEILNMQFCFFSQYIILFALGIHAGRGGWLLRIPRDFGMRWLAAALVPGSLLWVTLLWAGGAMSGDFSAYFGGWRWQSAAACIWEAFFCVGVCLGLLVWFRDRWNAQGPAARFLSDNAFAVYVFHPPVLVAITRGLHGLHWNPLAMFALATVLACAATWTASALLFRRIPLLRAVL